MANATNVVQSRPSTLEGPKRLRFSVPFEATGPLFALADASIIVAAGLLGGILYQLVISGSTGDAGVHAGLGLFASMAYAATAHHLGLYRLDELLKPERDHGRVGASWGLALLVLAVFLFLLKSGGEVSRGSAVCFSVLAGIALLLWRRMAKPRLRSLLLAGAIRGRRAILIGTANELVQFARRELLVRFGLDEVDRVVLPGNDPSNLYAGLQDIAAEPALQRVRETAAEEIILAMPWSRTADVELLLERFRVVPLPVRLLPDRAVSTILGRQTSTPPRTYMVEVQRGPLTASERLAKRLLDLAIASTSLVFLALLMTALAIAIKLESKGPVIFRQRRHGFNGEPFVIYKFRTMKVLEDGPIVVQATKQDPRVTRVGRLLRATSLDELPQLLNVLRGNMSIVGPRPHAVIHDYEYGKMIANYAFRHHVRPGITGWAQVQGSRGGTPQLELMERRVALDLWYINNWSLGLDIHIMLRTFFELIRQRNAY